MSERPEVVWLLAGWLLAAMATLPKTNPSVLGFAVGMTMMIDHHHHPSGSPYWN